MIPRKNLVPLKKEFSRIRASGKLYGSPSFGLVVSYGAKAGPLAAFIVSKKIDRRSVVRHEVKRKLADSMAVFLPRLPKNVELVFLVKQKAILANRDGLQTEAENVLRRARLL